MANLQELKAQIESANALGLKNLEEKGVAFPSSPAPTTYQIMGGIATIPAGGEGYDEGYEAGHTQGYTEGEKAGRENHEKDFWDTYQQNGNRVQYNYGFAGRGWADNTFKPKYDITPISASYIFAESQITNLKKILDDCGVVLDFSQSVTGSYPFKDSTITDVGVMDVSKYGNLNYFLHQASCLKSVDKVILNANGTQTFNSTYSFGGCEALEHIIFEGAIGKDINLSWSPLDYESVLSVANALVDYSGTDKAYEYTVAFNEITLNDLIDNHPEIFDLIDSKCWLS